MTEVMSTAPSRDANRKGANVGIRRRARQEGHPLQELRRPTVGAVLALAVLASISGCSNAPEHQSVTVTVTLDQNLLTDGTDLSSIPGIEIEVAGAGPDGNTRLTFHPSDRQLVQTLDASGASRVTVSVLESDFAHGGILCTDAPPQQQDFDGQQASLEFSIEVDPYCGATPGSGTAPPSTESFQGETTMTVAPGSAIAGYTATVKYSIGTVDATSSPATELGRSTIVATDTGSSIAVTNTTPDRSFDWNGKQFSVVAFYARESGVCEFLNEFRQFDAASIYGCEITLSSGRTGEPVSGGFAPLGPGEEYDIPLEEFSVGQELSLVPDEEVVNIISALRAPANLTVVMGRSDFGDFDIEGTCILGDDGDPLTAGPFDIVGSLSPIPPESCGQ